MAGVTRNRIGNDDVYEATTVIAGGQLVIPAAGATHPGVQGIDVAGNAAKNVLGVASRRAEPVASQSLSGTDGDGYPVVYPNPVNELVTVYKGCVLDVTYTAAVAGFGQKLVAAASGHVRAFVPQAETPGGSPTALTGDDPEAIIGECRVVGGMGSGGGLGKALIY